MLDLGCMHINRYVYREFFKLFFITNLIIEIHTQPSTYIHPHIIYPNELFAQCYTKPQHQLYLSKKPSTKKTK